MGSKIPKSLENYYQGQLHQKNFKLTRNGIQLWTVSYNDRYNILCFGGDVAQTDMEDLRLKGGKGAKVCGILVLSHGDQSKILVGQQGMNCYKRAALGGDGSFIVFDKNSELIIIAAGGHGMVHVIDHGKSVVVMVYSNSSRSRIEIM